MNGLERRPTQLPAHRLARRAFSAAVALGAGTLIVTLAIDQPISIDISGKVEGRAQVIIGTPQAVDRAIRELPPVQLARRVAFPGAEGYGAQATWGLKWGAERVARAGILPLIAVVAAPNDSICDRSNANILFVTNTNDSGAGSLRQAVADFKDDTLNIVVFRTGGRITLSDEILVESKNCGYIAGQSAPGDGIELYRDNALAMRVRVVDEMIVRYMRMDGDSGGGTSDALLIDGGDNHIYDHLSLRMGTDEVLSMRSTSSSRGDLTNVTAQWTIIGPGLRPHSTGSLIDGANDTSTVVKRITLNKVYYVHVAHRAPLFGDDSNDSAQVINQLVYNWRNWACGNDGSGAHLDFVRNYFIAGPWGPASSDRECTYQNGAKQYPQVYMFRNVSDSLDARILIDSLDDQEPFWEHRSTGAALPSSEFSGSRQMDPPVAVTEYNALQARDSVLTYAGMYQRLACDGTWTNVRDALDDSLIVHAQNITGPSSDTENDSPNDYGGFPSYSAGTACTDTDSDGIPDTYETAQCGTTTCMDARADDDGDGWINLEEYLNGSNP